MPLTPRRPRRSTPPRASQSPAAGSIRVPLAVAPSPQRALNAGVVFVVGFTAVIAVGTLLLMLPVSQAEGRVTGILDAAFTATSAVCVTGLVVVDTGTHWSFFGQVVLLTLMEIGGFGFMTTSTLLLQLAGQRTSLQNRLLLQESLGGGALGSTLRLARQTALFMLVVQAAGALVLTLAFLPEQPVHVAVWWGIFHAGSAFTNGSFDLTGGFRSMTPYQEAPVVLLTLATLIIAGGLSFAVVQDILRRRRFQRLTVDSKLVVVVTLSLLVVGALTLLFTERNNAATFAEQSPGTRLVNAFFLSAATRTAGFNAVDIAALTEGSLLIIIVLMLIGGATGSMAGGIKVQTLGILLSATVSAVRGSSDVVAFKRRVPTADILRAIAVTVLSFALVFLATFALAVTETQPFLRELFEVVSAFGTVGLSTGLTAETSPAGRLVLMVMMFAGRLGPLTLALALAERQHGSPFRWPAETVRIG